MMYSPPSPPRNEAELLRDLPPSHVPGAFPRALLPGTERILFETRPSVVGLYWGRLTLYIILMLFFVIPVSQPGYVENPFFWFLEGLFGALFVIAIVQWRMTAYALTNYRVLSVSGFRHEQFADCSYEGVQNLSTEPGSGGGLRFDCALPVLGFPTGAPPMVRRSIRWNALPDHPRVYAFVQEAFALHAALSAPATPAVSAPIPTQPHPAWAPAPASAPVAPVVPVVPPTPAPVAKAPTFTPTSPPPVPAAVPGAAPAAPVSNPTWGPVATPASTAPTSPPSPASRPTSMMKCPFCAASIDLRTLNYAAPTCPNCRQPIAPQA